MSQKALKFCIILIGFLVITGGFFVFSDNNALAALGINKQINFQGKVVNTDGTNVPDGNYDFIFAIYSQQAPGGSAIWTETRTGADRVAVTDGIFQVSLGSVTALPGSVDFNSDNIYLGVNFNANGEMTPRVQFTAAPYSFNSDMLDGKDWAIPGAIGSTAPNSGIFTSLGVVESGASPTYHTFFQGGDQIADITYTLPTLAPNGILRNTGGVLSWDTLSYIANPMTTVGDIIYGGASGAPTRLGGSAGFLTSSGSAAPSWTAASSDYFTQYALLAGRSGGQTLVGGTVANDVLTIEGNSAAAGNTGTNSNIVFNVGNNAATTALSLLNNGTSDFNHNQAVNFRVENANGSVVTPTCDSANQGRMYYDTGARSAFVCIETSPGVYGWFDYTATSVYSNKVVTVGTGGDYATIAAGAGYLSTLGGGIILLTPETHNVTSSVDLSNMSLIGANTGDTRINVTGAGAMRVKETQFKSLTIYVDSSIAATSAIDAKYDATTTTSVIFEWVDFITNGTKVLINSSEATAPTVRTRFISTSTTSGTQKIFLPKATADLSSASTHFIESQGGSGTLDVEDWNVKIAGSSNVKTSGTIETIPDSTIYLYPGMNLQSAINSLPSGGVITLLPGVHNISSTLLIDKDNIQIEGYGDASIVRAAGIAGSDTTGAIQVGSVDGASPNDGVVLKDFRLEVSGTGASDIHGIRMAGGSDNQILNVTVVKTNGASGTAAGARMGMLIMDGTAEKLVRPVIKGCRVLGTQSAAAYFTDGIHVTGGASYGAGSGIFTNGQGVEGALIDGNYVDYVRETVAVFVGVNNSSLYNNRFSRMGAGGGGAFGVFFGNSSNVNMTANVVATSLSAASYALVIDSINSGSLKQVTDSVFTANTIDGSANGGVGFQYGVNIGNATNTAFHRNIFTNNTINGASNAVTTALTLTGDADDNNFSNNVFNGINNPWDTGINIVSSAAERNLIGKNAFINTATFFIDSGTGTQRNVSQHEAASSPTVNDDSADGYTRGTIWINTATQNAYIATNVTVGAASWEQIDTVGGAGSTLQDAYTTDADGGNVNIVMTAADGSLVLQNAAGTQFAVTMAPATAPTLDLSSIINTGAGQGAATSGVDGLQIDFANSGATANDNAGMRVNMTSANNTAGTALEGIDIANIAGQANAVETALRIGTGWDVGVSIASGGMAISGGALAINNTAGITSNQATLNINASGNVDVQDALNADSISTDTGGMSIAAGQAYTGAGSVTYSSAAGTALTINSGTTGGIAIGDDASGETINIGTGAAAKTLLIGSANTTSMTTIQSGTGGISLQANGTGAGNVQIGDGGAASSTPDMLVLDTGSAEPAGTNGAMYYSTALNKFRCYENGKWKDCDSVKGVRSFVDSTADAVVDNNTTNYWDLAVENNNTYPNITPSSTSGEIFGVMTMETQSTGNGDVEVTARIERGVGAVPTCNAGTQVGGKAGTFASNTNARKTSTTSFIDSPATTSPVYYVICSDTDTVGTTANVTRLRLTLFEVTNSNADLAEIYPTFDTTLSPGEIVSVDPSLANGVKRSAGINDANIFGIVSTEPAMVIGSKGSEGNVGVAVALSGRVPVKVSAENGPIKSGDHLTASSIPGVAMRATKSGAVIGQALNSFDANGNELGSVMAFVKSAYFNGEKMVETDGSDMEGIAILQKLLADQIDISNSQALSEIVTDRLIAGTEIVTPQITTDSIVAKNIKADHIEGLEIMETGIADAQNSAENNAGEVKTLGQKISGIQKSINDLNDKYKNIIKSDLIEIGSKITVKSIVDFMDKVVFHKDVEFAGQVIFNHDTAGYAIVKEGQDKVRVAFENKYAVAPVVNASISLQQVEDNEVRKATEDLLLLSGVKFIITDVTEKGFEIRIDQKAASDVPFSWQAIAVNDVNTYKNKDKSKDDDASVAPEDDQSAEETVLSEVAAPVDTVSNADPAGAEDEQTVSEPAAAPNDPEAVQ